MKREELKEKIEQKFGEACGRYVVLVDMDAVMTLIDEYTKPKTKKKSLEGRQNACQLIDDYDKLSMFTKWLQYRKSLRKTIKVPETLDRLAKKFNDTDIETITQVVNHSIDNQYQGLFWDKFKNNGTTTKKETRVDAFKDRFNEGSL